MFNRNYGNSEYIGIIQKALLFYKTDYKTDNGVSNCTINLSLLHCKIYQAKASESQVFEIQGHLLISERLR